MNVIITGSNRGIGRAMVTAFANAGHNVWACARKSSPDFENFLNKLSLKNGVWVKPVYFELSDVNSINHAMLSIINEEKSIDVLVNNAGISTVKLLSMSKIEEIKSMFDVNYFSMLFLYSIPISLLINFFKAFAVLFCSFHFNLLFYLFQTL